MHKYILKRLLFMIPTLFAVSLVSFILIQLPPGDFLSMRINALLEQGQTIEVTMLHDLQERYGLGQPIYVQYWKWITGILLRGDFGQSFDWNELVGQAHLGPHRPHDADLARVAAVHLGGRLPHRDLLRGQAVLAGGLHRDLPRLHRHRDPGLSHCARAHVRGVQVLRLQRVRLVLCGLRGRAVELGQGRGPARAHLDPDDHHRARGHGEPDPHDAREPARRAEEALRGHRAGQGAFGGPADPQVPGARGAQPLYQHGRLDPADAGLRARRSSRSC